MSLRLAKLICLVGLLVLLVPTPAAAQWENIDTVEGAQGQDMILTVQPHQLAEGLSARALSIVRRDSTRWALGLIGVPPGEDVSLTYGDEALPIYRVERPEDGIGPVRVFVSGETFLTLAESGSAAIHVGNVRAALPDQLRREMRRIFEKST